MKKILGEIWEIIKILCIGGVGFVIYLFCNKGDKDKIKQKLGKIKVKKVKPKKTRYDNQSLDETIERMR